MDRSPLVLRVAALERDYWFVDVALLFSFAAWVPDGFRPIWLPVAFACAAGAFAVAYGTVSRYVGAIVERRLARSRRETIVVTDDGFMRHGPSRKSTVRCAWTDVRRVYAFKRDLATTDLVCVAFVTHDAVVETNERADGWRALVDALPATVPGCEPFATWYLEVAKGPFQTRPRRIDAGPHGDVADPDAEPADESGAAIGIRAYAELGTTGMLLAVAILLAAIGLVRGPSSLALVAAVEVVALALTRGALFGALAVRARPTRTR